MKLIDKIAFLYLKDGKILSTRSRDIAADNEIEEIRWLTMEDMDIISPVDKLIFTQLNKDGLMN